MKHWKRNNYGEQLSSHMGHVCLLDIHTHPLESWSAPGVSDRGNSVPGEGELGIGGVVQTDSVLGGQGCLLAWSLLQDV